MWKIKFYTYFFYCNSDLYLFAETCPNDSEVQIWWPAYHGEWYTTRLRDGGRRHHRGVPAADWWFLPFTSCAVVTLPCRKLLSWSLALTPTVLWRKQCVFCLQEYLKLIHYILCDFLYISFSFVFLFFWNLTSGLSKRVAFIIYIWHIK